MLWLLLNGSVKLLLHQLADIQVKEVKKHTERGRPSKDACPTFYYQVDALLELKETALAVEIKRAGRFILATNVIDTKELSDDDALREYKAQQSTERGFRFLKDPLFLLQVSSSTQLSESALAMVMGLCLLVYSLVKGLYVKPWNGQKNCWESGKLTTTPTLRWVFQCFMSFSYGCTNQANC